MVHTHSSATATSPTPWPRLKWHGHCYRRGRCFCTHHACCNTLALMQELLSRGSPCLFTTTLSYPYPPFSAPLLSHPPGIGFQTAKVLCNKGYDVTIACRDPTRAQNAVTALKAADPSASISYILMELANLQSVRDAAAAWLDSGKQIDVLLNNAGRRQGVCAGSNDW